MSDPLRVALDVEIPSDVRYIERIVELVTRQCEAPLLTPRRIAPKVPGALTEAISNAILRGNHEDRGKHVRVRASVSDTALVLEVFDEGRGFDMNTSTRDPTLTENILREDGRGLFL